MWQARLTHTSTHLSFPAAHLPWRLRACSHTRTAPGRQQSSGARTRGAMESTEPSSTQQDSASPSTSGRRPVLLFDVMDTVVYDPFFHEMPKFFDMTFQELLRDKHPTAWVDFECGHIDEEHLCRIFFADGRPVDQAGLRQMLMHALSNYPVWYQIIEEKLRLSRFMDWTFVSCVGPMKGVRKPAPEAYKRVVDHLGLPPHELLFVDDRKNNIEAAEKEGVPSVRFSGASELEAALRDRGLSF